LANQKLVKSRVAYLTKKNKNLLLSLAVASAQIARKICQCQQRTVYSECPKFNPNWFTSGRVMAERVNTVETRDKMFPIFGRSLASSRINMLQTLLVATCLTWMNMKN